MKNERNVITLSKWLVTKGCTSLLKIQKLLFFLRYEELKNNETTGSYFKDNHNFKAWIYGPVNTESFSYLQPWFEKQEEADAYYLTDAKLIDEIEKKYGSYFEKYNKYTPPELVEKSHKNLSWIKARKGYGPKELCKEYMDEKGPEFISFEE